MSFTAGGVRGLPHDLGALQVILANHLLVIEKSNIGALQRAASTPRPVMTARTHRASTTDETRYGPAGQTRFRGNVVALTARNRQAGLTIGPQTPIPDWDGAPMDDAMAVEGLLQRE